MDEEKIVLGPVPDILHGVLHVAYAPCCRHNEEQPRFL